MSVNSKVKSGAKSASKKVKKTASAANNTKKSPAKKTAVKTSPAKTRKPVTVVIIGAGGRGNGYSSLIENLGGRAKVVGVAEPRDYYRERLAKIHGIPKERQFKCWSEVAKVPRFADAVFVCTQDHMHEAPAIAFAKLGYNIMLEKPMAPTADSCRRIVEAAKKAKIYFGVCHVLRYTKYTRMIKEIVDSGKIGDIVSIQHLEPVGFWHQAHSFVRGNWRNEKESSSMLLAKSCHDIDWLSYIMGVPCLKVQSFGTLKHFRKECQPKGAGDRCLECPSSIEKKCPYSAIKIYLRDRIRKGLKGWPTDVLTPDLTEKGVMKALKEGPYGRCVYKCDNDVVDNQVVNLLFEGGRTCTFTMTAFNAHGGRQTRIFGTKGCLETDSRLINVTDFLTGKVTTVDTELANDGTIIGGHGGGDGGIVDAFIHALETKDASRIVSGPNATLESHMIVFGAEESRHKNKVIDINKK